MSKPRLMVAVAVAILAMAVPSAFAGTSSPFSGTWNVTYYNPGSGPTCTTLGSVWTVPTLGGGVSGFAKNNVGGPPTTALVSYGKSICIVLSVSGASVTDGTVVYFGLPGTGTVACFTIKGGAGNDKTQSGTCGSGTGSSGPLLFTNNVSGSGTLVCTIPIFVNTSNPPNGRGSGQADHLVLGTTSGLACGQHPTPPITNVPQFPAGMLAIFGLATAALLPLRRRSGK